MYTIIAKDLCGCFDLRAPKFQTQFENKEEAIEYTTKLCKKFNKKFCGKHHFCFEIEDTNLILKMKVVK